MCLEGVDGAFGQIDLAGIRRHELVVTFPFLRDYTLVLLDGSFVKYLEVHLVATLMEAVHDPLVGSDMMEVLLGLEGIDQDFVAAAVVGQHDVLVATTRSDGETTHVIGVEFSGVLNTDVKFVGSDRRKRFL